jgi:hypothetical protein
MRILLLAVLIFVTFHFIRLDLVEGTIPLASYVTEPQQCEEEKTTTITVTTVDGDTIETLFALYPDSESSFIDRLSSFYSLNPHLENQQIIGGEKITLPLSNLQAKKCIESN